MASSSSLPQLTADHLANFERDGFLHLRAQEHGLVPDTAALSRWADEIYQWPLEKGKWMPYDEVNPEGKRLVMRTEKIVDYHSGAQSLLCGPGVHSLFQQLTGKVSFFPLAPLSLYTDEAGSLTHVWRKGDVAVQGQGQL